MKSCLLSLTLLMLALAGCRGDISEQPPIHPIRNMMDQPRFDPQETNPFFADKRSQRLPVPGTVSRSGLKLDPVFYQGKNPDGSFVHDNPLPVNLELLQRGQERFNIYCAVCHGRTGNGKGIVITNYQGFVPPPSYHDDRIRAMGDGELFNVVTNGVRTMPSYRHQVVEHDRWAIIAYLRALQRSQAAPLADVPKEKMSLLDQ